MGLQTQNERETGDIEMSQERKALKTEIMELVKRRYGDDERDASKIYSDCSIVLASVIADLTFSAAHDERHANHLLKIIESYVRSRWKALAEAEGDQVLIDS